MRDDQHVGDQPTELRQRLSPAIHAERDHNTMFVIDTDTCCTPHLKDLKEKHGVTHIGRYYAATGSWKRLTKTEARAISDAGLQLFTVYEGSGDPELSVDRGRHDAQVAMSQAKNIGQPAGTPIYFAMEHLPSGYKAAHVPGI